MKIYFTYSSSLPSNAYYKIVETLNHLGHQVMCRSHPNDYYSLKHVDAEKVFKENLLNIKRCSLVIAETSFASSGLGYEISKSLDLNKPVIALYNLVDYMNIPGNLDVIPINLQGNSSRYLLLKEYKLTNLRKQISLSLTDMNYLINTKFNLHLTSEINEYLEWKSKSSRIAKSEVVRAALKTLVYSDKEYKKYQKEI